MRRLWTACIGVAIIGALHAGTAGSSQFRWLRYAPPGAQLARQITPQQAVTRAEVAASSFWGNPPCGTPAIVSTILPSNIEGKAYNCQIHVTPTVLTEGADGPRQYFELCRVVAHEWGHLKLGDSYFAASNPKDPAHSPDVGNLMYALLSTTIPQCVSSLPTLDRVDRHLYRIRVIVSRNDECVGVGHGIEPAQSARIDYLAWRCPITNRVTPTPAPESPARLRQLLTALVTDG